MSAYLTGLTLRAAPVFRGPYRLTIMIFLSDRADDRTGICLPASLSFLARACDISVSTLKKYRKGLGPKQKPEDESLEIIDWVAHPGRGGIAVYTIDVERLKYFADNVKWGEDVNGRPAPILDFLNGRETPIKTGLNGRDAPTSLSIYLSIKESDSFFSPFVVRDYSLDESAKPYGPDFDNHPAFVMYCEAFGFHPSSFEPRTKKLFAKEVELTEGSLWCWAQTLNHWLYMATYNPNNLTNLFDNYTRRRNGQFRDLSKPIEKTGDTTVPPRIGTKKGTRNTKSSTPKRKRTREPLTLEQFKEQNGF